MNVLNARGGVGLNIDEFSQFDAVMRVDGRERDMVSAPFVHEGCLCYVYSGDSFLCNYQYILHDVAVSCFALCQHVFRYFGPHHGLQHCVETHVVRKCVSIANRTQVLD